MKRTFCCLSSIVVLSSCQNIEANILTNRGKYFNNVFAIKTFSNASGTYAVTHERHDDNLPVSDIEISGLFTERIIPTLQDTPIKVPQ